MEHRLSIVSFYSTVIVLLTKIITTDYNRGHAVGQLVDWGQGVEQFVDRGQWWSNWLRQCDK
jgi:hypothetical protein